MTREKFTRLAGKAFVFPKMKVVLTIKSPQVDDFKDFGVPRVNVVRCALAE